MKKILEWGAMRFMRRNPGTVLRLLFALVAFFVLAHPSWSAAEEAATVAAPAPSADADNVVIPNFWDLRSRIERPSAEDIGAIRFLTTDDFPPFSFRDRRGILIGFDVDLAQAICGVLKVQCAIQTRPFNTLVQGLKDGTGNAIIAGFDLDRASADGLIASQAYFKIPGRFVVQKDSTFSPGKAAASTTVGAVCGTAHAAYLSHFFPGLNATCSNRMAEPLAALQAGKLDAVFGDALRLSFWLNGKESKDCCRFAGGAYLDDDYFGSGLAIVMKAEDRSLKIAIDYALREVYRSGAYEDLYLRYFPVGLF